MVSGPPAPGKGLTTLSLLLEVIQSPQQLAGGRGRPEEGWGLGEDCLGKQGWWWGSLHLGEKHTKGAPPASASPGGVEPGAGAKIRDPEGGVSPSAHTPSLGLEVTFHRMTEGFRPKPRSERHFRNKVLGIPWNTIHLYSQVRLVDIQTQDLESPEPRQF